VKLNQIRAGVSLSFISMGIKNLIGLMYIPIMLRIMGQSEFGMYSLIMSIISYITVLDFGFGNAIIRYTSKLLAQGNVKKMYEMFGMFIILYSLIGLISFFTGMFIYYNLDYFFGETFNFIELNKISIMLIIASLNVAISFPFSIFSSVIVANEKFVFYKAVSIVVAILNPILMLCVLFLGHRAIGMLLVTTFFNIFAFVIYTWYSFKILKIRISFKNIDLLYLKKISTYSFWVFINSIIEKIYWNSGQFIIAINYGPASIAPYAIAVQLQSLYVNFTQAFSGVFLPKITTMITNNVDSSQISDLFIRLGRVQYIIVSLVLFGFFLFGEQFILLWAGSENIDSYLMTLLFFIASTIPMLQNIGILTLQSLNRMKFYSILNLLIGIISLIIAYPLVKIYGGLSYVITISAALLIGQGLIMNIFYHKILKIDILGFWREIIKMSTMPLLVTTLTYFVLNINPNKSTLNLVISIIIYSSVYLICFWFHGMNDYEKKMISSPFKKYLK
tara:strand:- start:1729 stop:3240 length:1512 start_codon:yes stop_codon:yes gene_type:complete